MIIDDLKTNYSFGMRALGAIQGTYHSNTLEGFNHWKKHDIYFWETDVAVTDDNRYVMVGHFVDKETMSRMEIKDLPEQYTYDWFMKQKLFPKSTKGLTPLSLEDIVDIAKVNKNFVFMFDLYPFSLKDSSRQTSMFFSFLSTLVGSNSELYERFIFEAYNKEMLLVIKNISCVKNIQLSVTGFMENENIDDIESFIDIALENKVNVISYEWRYAKKHLQRLDALKKQDFLLVSRSITNLFSNKKKKKNGVNIALLDFYVKKPTDFFSLAELAVSRLKKKHG